MKRLFYALLVVGLAVLCMPVQLLAQDTLDIDPLPPGNINNVINGDTLVGGVRANPDRVYRLQRGVVYQVTESIAPYGNMKLMGAAGTDRPPVVMPAILPDNSSPFMLVNLRGPASKVEISDIYFLDSRSDGKWNNGFAINESADSIYLKVRRLVLDGFTNAIHSNGRSWEKYDIQDCHFRNIAPNQGWYSGQPFVPGGWGDTIKVINNTFFVCDAYAGGQSFFRPFIIEHNTYVYGLVNPFLMRQQANHYIRNNVFYAMNGHGGDANDIINSGYTNYPDTNSSGVIMLRDLDTTSYWAHLWWDAANNKPGRILGPESKVNPALGFPTYDPTKRVADVRANAWFLPKGLTDYYTAYNDTVASYDSINVPVYGVGARNMWLKRRLYWPKFITDYTRWTIDSGVGRIAPGIHVEDAIVADPGFPQDIVDHVQQQTAYINMLITKNFQPLRWNYPNNTGFPVTWPLPENLAYTNQALMTAGTDGLPLGDLNWFPDKKAEWERLTDVKQVENAIPTAFALEQNYPNPFNPSTTIEFALPKQAKVSLKVYNLLGQEVATLVNQTLSAGRYTSNFDAATLATGTYIYRLSADNVVKTSKMMLVK